MPPIIDYDLCTACGDCYDVCSQDVYFSTKPGEEPVVTYPEACWHCNACVMDCPAGAIRLRIPLPCMIMYKEVV